MKHHFYISDGSNLSNPQSICFYPGNAHVTYTSKAVVPVLFLLCVTLWFILRGASCFKDFPCSLSSCFFIPFSIVITSLTEEAAGLYVSRAIVLYLFVFGHILFRLVSGVGCGLWLWHSLDFSIHVFTMPPTLVNCSLSNN